MPAGLEKHLPRPIKEVITEFPGLVDILNGYDIACGSCMVGTCLLKDIVSIHSLPPDTEKELMAGIAAAIAPVEGGQIPAAATAAPKKRGEITYSPPIKRLVAEHVLIKKLLALIPAVIKNLDVNSEEGKKNVTDVIDFIRSYADRFHHGKEEDVLFKYFDENSEIIQAMRSDHKTGRGHVKTIGEALEKGDANTVGL